MNYEILTTNYFDTEAKRLKKRYRSFIDDLINFQDSIKNNPYQGIELSPGIRKIRMSITSKGKGKSGGARIITLTYCVSENNGTIVLLLIYDKANTNSIKTSVVKKIVKEVGIDLEKVKTL